MKLRIYKDKSGWIAKLKRPEWLGESTIVGFYSSWQEAFDRGCLAYRFYSPNPELLNGLALGNS